jgi:hypothetical protein
MPRRAALIFYFGEKFRLRKLDAARQKVPMPVQAVQIVQPLRFVQNV